MDLKEIHDWINFIIDKEQGGWFPPEEIDSALDKAQLSLFNQYRDRYAINQQDQDALGPFKIRYTFTNSKTPSGVLSFPQNYQSFLGAYRQTTSPAGIRYKQIEIINDDELAERLSSSLRPVTENDPIGQWIGRGEIQLWPQVPNAGYAYYLRRPDAPEFVYTMNGRTVVYDDIQSVQLEWDDANTQKIMIKAIEFLGVNLDNDKLIAYTKL
jgi:hypothetical protein